MAILHTGMCGHFHLHSPMVDVDAWMAATLDLDWTFESYDICSSSGGPYRHIENFQTGVTIGYSSGGISGPYFHPGTDFPHFYQRMLSPAPVSFYGNAEPTGRKEWNIRNPISKSKRKWRPPSGSRHCGNGVRGSGLQAGEFEFIAVEFAGQLVAVDLDVGYLLLHGAHGLLGLLHDGLCGSGVDSIHLEYREV